MKISTKDLRGLAALWLLLLITVLSNANNAQPAEGLFSRYDFKYFYTDNHGDYYTGFLYAPTDFQTSGPFINVGSSIYYHPDEMGGEALGGHYYITGITNGFSSSYDKQEYITGYFDMDSSGKSSYIFSTGLNNATFSYLFVSNRPHEVELGYVYDPSVPSSDPYYGNGDTVYSFSTKKQADFLSVYITDLPYWTQPSDYCGSCSQVAGAILLSYWDKSGYSNLIIPDWQNNWLDCPGYCQDNPDSYVSFIATLAYDMGYLPNIGTYSNKIGPGLLDYTKDQGYAISSLYSEGFTYYYGDVYWNRSGGWNAYKAALDAGRPVIVDILWSAGGHSTVGRGYWNNGDVLLNFGWGLSYTNEKINWNRTRYGTSPTQAMVFDFIDYYYISY
ncbi:MAG: hypothetical protein ACOZFS_06900 [Thermodesulfobacteriota bacterium]